jgi:NitT/TauT family transport system permease protein
MNSHRTTQVDKHPEKKPDRKPGNKIKGNRMKGNRITGKSPSFADHPAAGVVVPLVAVSLAIAAWAGFKSAFGVSDYLLPSPMAVLRAFTEQPRMYLHATAETAICASLGFCMAATGGVALASLLSLFRVVERGMYPLTLLFQMVPLIAIAPLLVIWFGYGRPSIVACATIVSIFPVIANTLAGLRGRDAGLQELFAILGAGRFTTWWKLALPSAVPSILTGLRIAAGLATIGTIAGEFIGSDRQPLGVLITTNLRSSQTAAVFASVILAACVGFALFGAVTVLGQWIFARWLRST